MVRLTHTPAGEGADRERGAVLVVTAFIFFGLLTVAALVVDIVVVNQAQLRAQATVDSAVLAAAMDIDDIGLATAAAQEYAARNYDVAAGDWGSCTDPGALVVATSVPCISIDDAADPRHIRVRLPDRTVPSFFASVLGRDGFSVSAAAVAEIEYLGGSLVGSGVPSEDLIEEKREEIAAAYGNWAGIDTSGEFSSKDNPYTMGDDPTLDALFADLVALQQSVADVIRGENVCDVGATPTGPPDTSGLGQKWGEYIFFFEHLPLPLATEGEVTKVCGTSADVTFPPGGPSVQWGMDTWIDEIGGTSHPGPGMPMHVSCSLNFIAQDGWDNEGKVKFGGRPNGPVQGLDTDWHVVQYIGARWEISKGAEDPKIERKMKSGEFTLKVTPAIPPQGEIFLKQGCNYAFTAVTSSFTAVIRLSL